MLAIEEITSGAQLMALQAGWDNLLKQNGEYSPFLTYDWFRCCVVAHSRGKEMFTLAVKDGSNLIGIAPLWRQRDVFRKIPIRKIGFMSCPDTQMADFIVEDGRRSEVLMAFLDYMFHERKGAWDMLTLEQWPAESMNYKAFQAILQGQRKRFFTGISSVTPYIPIRGEWEPFLQTLSVRFRKTRRNITNRIEKLNKLEIQCFRQDPTGSVFKDVAAVSGKSWKQEEGIAITSQEETNQFFAALTDAAGPKGLLLIWILKLDGTPIAMEYDLEADGKVYALRADYDEAYKEYSPGAYLEYQIVKSLFKEGYQEYSIGPGLNAYKLQWTEQSWENMTLHVCNDNPKGWIIWGLQNGLIPFLRRVRNLSTRIS
jgi:CelD/BcsL family acetyltransferase involved in cellulose biosynthesis